MATEQYTITLKVGLDENKVPEILSWDASDSDNIKNKEIKAFLLSMFDSETREYLENRSLDQGFSGDGDGQIFLSNFQGHVRYLSEIHAE